MEADRALVGISDAVANITDMTTQIAAATEEQSCGGRRGQPQHQHHFAHLADQTSDRRTSLCHAQRRADEHWQLRSTRWWSASTADWSGDNKKTRRAKASGFFIACLKIDSAWQTTFASRARSHFGT
jgi:hypothetical protein